MVRAESRSLPAGDLCDQLLRGAGTLAEPGRPLREDSSEEPDAGGISFPRSVNCQCSTMWARDRGERLPCEEGRQGLDAAAHQRAREHRPGSRPPELPVAEVVHCPRPRRPLPLRKQPSPRRCPSSRAHRQPARQRGPAGSRAGSLPRSRTRLPPRGAVQRAESSRGQTTHQRDDHRGCGRTSEDAPAPSRQEFDDGRARPRDVASRQGQRREREDRHVRRPRYVTEVRRDPGHQERDGRDDGRGSESFLPAERRISNRHGASSPLPRHHPSRSARSIWRQTHDLRPLGPRIEHQDSGACTASPWSSMSRPVSAARSRLASWMP